MLFLFPDLQHENYKLVINLEVDNSLAQVFDEIFFYVSYSNSSFTVFLIAFRSFLLVLSILTGCLYLRFYTSISKDSVTFEHRFIGILSIALIFLNDPIYVVSVLYGYLPLVVISTSYIAMFFSLVLFFNLVMYKRMHAEIDKKETNLITDLNIATAAAVFILLASILIVLAVYSRFDPTVNVATE